MLQPKAKAARPAKAGEDWTGVDRALFEELRAWRKEEAVARAVPPFVIFGDRTLRALASMRPSSTDRLRAIPGIGEAKLAEYGDALLGLIRDYSSRTGIELDIAVSHAAPSREKPRASGRSSDAKKQALAALLEGEPLDEVARASGRARSTVVGYLCELIEQGRIDSVSPWIDDARYRAIAEAREESPEGRLAPIREKLGPDFSYEEIRIAMTHLGAAS